MRFAEIENGKVRYVLPAELSEAYTIIPPNCIEIGINDEVSEGDFYENGVFRSPTEEEILIPYKEAFNNERNSLFSSTEWVRQRHSDRLELGVDDAENWTDWLNYWQALRDLPETEGFDYRNVIYPVKPE